MLYYSLYTNTLKYLYKAMLLGKSSLTAIQSIEPHDKWNVAVILWGFFPDCSKRLQIDEIGGSEKLFGSKITLQEDDLAKYTVDLDLSFKASLAKEASNQFLNEEEKQRLKSKYTLAF